MDDTGTPWLNDREQQVWRRWLRVQSELPVALGRAMAQGSGLSLQDYETLVNLSEAPDQRLRVSVLAERMHWERSRLSHHLRRMETRGLIAKEGCPEDARGAFVELTAAGREALEVAAPAHVRSVRASFLDAMEPGDLEALDAILVRVLERLEV